LLSINFINTGKVGLKDLDFQTQIPSAGKRNEKAEAFTPAERGIGPVFGGESKINEG
jgi:hypothetical protein